MLLLNWATEQIRIRSRALTSLEVVTKTRKPHLQRKLSSAGGIFSPSAEDKQFGGKQSFTKTEQEWSQRNDRDNFVKHFHILQPSPPLQLSQGHNQQRSGDSLQILLPHTSDMMAKG